MTAAGRGSPQIKHTARRDAVSLDSSKECRAVHTAAGGSTVSTTNAPSACAERRYDLVALPSFVLVSNAGLVS